MVPFRPTGDHALYPQLNVEAEPWEGRSHLDSAAKWYDVAHRRQLHLSMSSSPIPQTTVAPVEDPLIDDLLDGCSVVVQGLVLELVPPLDPVVLCSEYRRSNVC